MARTSQTLNRFRSWFAYSIVALFSGCQIEMVPFFPQPRLDSPTAPGPSAYLHLQSLSSSFVDACALTQGALYCWGSGLYGQQGNNSTSDNLIATQVVGLAGTITSFSAGKSVSCAIASGALYCWGSSPSTGDGTNANHYTPVTVLGMSSNVTSVAAGSDHACAVMSGAAYCWGLNPAGGLGNNTTTDSNQPVGVSSLGAGVTAVTVDDDAGPGLSFSCAIASGGVWCWGSNSNGQLGDGTTTDRHTPVAVSGMASGVTQVSAGANHACAIKSGALWCWGRNDAGQIGDGTTTDRLIPVQITTFASAVSQIELGNSASCAIYTGAAWCWGSNVYAQLGLGYTGGQVAIPSQVTGLTSGVTSIGINQQSACAVRNNIGYCWGSEAYGALGNDSNSSSSYVPIPISPF